MSSSNNHNYTQADWNRLIGFGVSLLYLWDNKKLSKFIVKLGVRTNISSSGAQNTFKPVTEMLAVMIVRLGYVSDWQLVLEHLWPILKYLLDFTTKLQYKQNNSKK